MKLQTSYWTSAKILLREAVFGGYIVNLSPLRVGAGEEVPLGSPAKLALLKVTYEGKSIPYIPGSSLKGVFRSQAEALARTRGLKVCSGLSKSTCMEIKKPPRPEAGEENLLEYVQQRLKEQQDEEAMKVFFEASCLMCKVFGAPGYASKVTFTDAYPVSNDGKVTAPATGIRTGIAIDRRTGAVYQNAFYTAEYIEPGARFRFSITARNLPNYALGLLAAVLAMMKRGEVRLGGFKTRGFGEVTIHDPYIKVREFPSTTTTLRKLEEDVDVKLDVSGLVLEKDGWLFAEGEQAWKLLAILEGAWRNATVTR
jgi:CRISPR-associated RAMP protein (TIGR02581 family)